MTDFVRRLVRTNSHHSQNTPYHDTSPDSITSKTWCTLRTGRPPRATLRPVRRTSTETSAKTQRGFWIYATERTTGSSASGAFLSMINRVQCTQPQEGYYAKFSSSGQGKYIPWNLFTCPTPNPTLLYSFALRVHTTHTGSDPTGLPWGSHHHRKPH